MTDNQPTNVRKVIIIIIVKKSPRGGNYFKSWSKHLTDETCTQLFYLSVLYILLPINADFILSLQRIFSTISNFYLDIYVFGKSFVVANFHYCWNGKQKHHGVDLDHGYCRVTTSYNKGWN